MQGDVVEVRHTCGLELLDAHRAKRTRRLSPLCPSERINDDTLA